MNHIDWIQAVSNLHRQVEILYVVDGYEVTIVWDGAPISESFHGETVAEAIEKAIMGFDLESIPKRQEYFFDEAAERKAFEDWVFSRWPTIRRLRINLPGYPSDGEYGLEGLQAAWTGYLACAKHKAGVKS